MYKKLVFFVLHERIEVIYVILMKHIYMYSTHSEMFIICKAFHTHKCNLYDYNKHFYFTPVPRSLLL